VRLDEQVTSGHLATHPFDLMDRQHEYVRLHDGIGLELDVERRRVHLTDRIPPEVLHERVQQESDGTLMRLVRRRRHEQLPVHELVTGRRQRALGNELAHFARGPAALDGRHWWNGDEES
jgi:hypothetical protein